MLIKPVLRQPELPASGADNVISKIIATKRDLQRRRVSLNISLSVVSRRHFCSDNICMEGAFSKYLNKLFRKSLGLFVRDLKG